MRETLNFEKTLSQLKSYLSEPIQDDRDRAGIIQAFEFTYEQAWKSVQKKAAGQGVQVASPKQAFMFALQTNWIDPSDEPKWIKMIEDRNLTSHTYREDIAKQVLARIQMDYLTMFERLLDKLLAAK